MVVPAMGDGVRRWRPPTAISAFGLAGAVLVALAIAVPAPEGTAASTVLFGANPGLDANGSRLVPLEDMEEAIGRPLDLVRVFERWDAEWDSAFHQAVENGDRVMHLSVKAKRENGSVIAWDDIASATTGSALFNEIQTWIDRVETFDGEVWFTFHHEPESSASNDNGNDSEFIAAWQRIVDDFRDRNVANVEFAWVMTYWSFATDPSEPNHADKWYPGDDYVDLIGSDAYNWDFCRGGTTDPWTSLEDTIEPQRQFGLDHPGKGLILGEWASTEVPGDGGAAKSRWITDAAQLFQQPGWEQFVGLAYFNIDDASYPECPWPLDSSDQAMAAFVAMADDPFYGGAGSFACNGRRATMVGSPRADDLPGTPADDVIVARGGADVIGGGAGEDALCGWGGNDTIDAGGGADFVSGGAGRDVIDGGWGPDVIYGGDGPDEISGGAGNDTVWAGKGVDIVFGDGGADQLFGDGAADEIHGGIGYDEIQGGPGTDLVNGDDGNDTVIGGGGADEVNGGSGADTLKGWGGNDSLFGGPGDDVLYGGAGNDSCTGGAGSDTLLGC